MGVTLDYRSPSPRRRRQVDWPRIGFVGGLTAYLLLGIASLAPSLHNDSPYPVIWAGALLPASALLVWGRLRYRKKLQPRRRLVLGYVLWTVSGFFGSVGLYGLAYGIDPHIPMRCYMNIDRLGGAMHFYAADRRTNCWRTS